MNTKALLEQAGKLESSERWELAAALWESLEMSEFPVSDETRALLLARRGEVGTLPDSARTWADVRADWHNTAR